MSSHDLEGEVFRLGPDAWHLLLPAASEVVEMLQDDLDALRGGEPPSQMNLAGLLPSRLRPRYDAAFAERLAGTAQSLADRLARAHAAGWGYPPETFLNSVAEEVLMAQIIRLAIEDSTSAAQVEELSTLEDLSFEDRDFEWTSATTG